MNINKIAFTPVVLAGLAALALGACSGGYTSAGYGSAYYPTDRYVSSMHFEGNPYAFDSEIYYDPYYSYRGTGWFRPAYRLRPY